MSAHVNTPTPIVWERYIAIDLHKHYLMVGGINAQQQVVLTPRKITLDRWLDWAQATLRSTDAVVIEATTNAWHIYDQLVPLVGRVVVAHPPKVKQIAAARVKTDKHDVLILAQLLRADLIPEVTQRVPGATSARARFTRSNQPPAAPAAGTYHGAQSPAFAHSSLQSHAATWRSVCCQAAPLVGEPEPDPD
jgi:hypothetical protein